MSASADLRRQVEDAIGQVREARLAAVPVSDCAGEALAIALHCLGRAQTALLWEAAQAAAAEKKEAA